MRRYSPFSLACAAMLFAADLGADVRLVPESVEDFFLNPGEPSALGFVLEGSPAGGSIEYRVRDFYGEERYRSSVAPSEGRVSVTLERDAGYHELYFPESGQAFGIGVIDRFDGETDEFFGIDAGLSWRAGEAAREGLVANLARIGIGGARERLDWRAINPRNETWHWHARESMLHPYPGAYERLRIIYRDHGIDVVDLFHTAPDWLREERNPFPVDLVGTSNSWSTIGERWADYLGGVEAWTKVDAGSGGFLPADQYVSFLRALRYAFDRNEARIPLGGGGFEFFNPTYLDLAARNELLEEIDYLSFQFFSEPLLMEQTVGRYRNWLREYGREGMPLWLTEGGPGWQQHESRPAFQVQRQASLKYVMNAVEAKATGVARYFPSGYTRPSPDEERAGMTDEYGSPLRSMVVYAYAVKALSNREYVGDIELEGDTVKRARVFTGADGDAVIVLYTAQPAWIQTVTLPFRPNEITRIDGRVMPTGAGNNVPIANGLVYVWADASEVEPYLNREGRAFELNAASRVERSTRSQASPVVLQPRLRLERGGGASQIGYSVSPNSSQVLLPVRIHNLGDSEVDLEIRARESAAPGESSTLGSSRVSVPGRGHTDVIFDILPSMLSPEQGMARIEVTATSDGIPRIAPLVINLLLPQGLDDYINSFPIRQVLSLRDLERRTELTTTPGVGATTMIVTRDGGWRITGDFTEPGNSRLTLELSALGAVRWDDVEAVVLRVRFDRPTRAQLRVWTDFDTSHYSVNRMIRNDGEWGTFLFPLNGAHFYTNQRLGDDQIDRLRAGLPPLDRLSLDFTHLDAENTGNVLEIGAIIFVGGSELEDFRGARF